jgi:hypothetical protein
MPCRAVLCRSAPVLHPGVQHIKVQHHESREQRQCADWLAAPAAEVHMRGERCAQPLAPALQARGFMELKTLSFFSFPLLWSGNVGGGLCSGWRSRSCCMPAEVGSLHSCWLVHLGYTWRCCQHERVTAYSRHKLRHVLPDVSAVACCMLPTRCCLQATSSPGLCCQWSGGTPADTQAQIAARPWASLAALAPAAPWAVNHHHQLCKARHALNNSTLSRCTACLA